MKRLIGIFTAVFLLLIITGCESTANQTKEVENLEITLTFPVWEGTESKTIERNGIYTGTVQNDLPDGKGKFETQSDVGELWYYEGAFKDGLFHGFGSMIWLATDKTPELSCTGNFVDGLYTPTPSQLFATISPNVLVPFTFADESISIIDQNESLFPCTTSENEQLAISLTDTSVLHKDLVEGVSNHFSKLHLVQDFRIFEIMDEEFEGHTITTMLLTGDFFSKYYLVYYDGSLEINSGDTVNVYGLPVATSSLDNFGGDKTNVPILLGSIVKTT